MASHVQRKLFHSLQLAAEVAAGFRHIAPSIVGAKVSAGVRQDDDQCWVYVSHVGDLVLGNEPLLPGYERV